MNPGKFILVRLSVYFLLFASLFFWPVSTSAAPLPQGDNPATQCAKGERLFLDDKVAEALPLLEAGFAGHKKAVFVTLDDLGICALYLGTLRDQGGNLNGALETYTVALDVFKHSGNRGFEGATLLGIGKVHMTLEHYAEAVNYFQQALAIWREVDDQEGEAATLNNLGSVYRKQKSYGDALDVYQSALVIWRKVGDKANVAAVLNHIGAIYHDQLAYQEALVVYQEALTIHREIRDKDGEQAMLYNIGLLYQAQDHYDGALNHFEQSLEIVREMGNSAAEGETLYKIGGIYHLQARYRDALNVFQKALIIMREVNDRVGEGGVLNNIGTVYLSQGRYGDALDYLNRALVVVRGVGDRAGEGRTLSSIAVVYDKQGRPIEELLYLLQALEIASSMGDRVGEEGALNNLGTLYRSQDEYTKALEVYQQALTISREMGDRQGESRILNNIGSVVEKQERFVDALNYFQQALNIRREVGDRAGEGKTLNNIGNVYNSQKRYNQALEAYQQALVISREVGNQEQEGIALYSIGSIYQQKKEPDQALVYYEQAMNIFDSVRAVAGNEEGRAGFIEKYAYIYYSAVEVYYQQNQFEKAFITSERGRARAFLDTMVTGSVQLSDNTAATLYIQEQETFAVYQAAKNALAKAKSQNLPDEKLIADLDEKLAQVEKNYQTALDTISLRNDQLQQLVSGRSKVINVSQAQALLDDQTTLLSFWVFNEHVLAFILTEDTFNTVALPIAWDDLYGGIRSFENFANTYSAYPENAETLYKALIEPLKSQLTTQNLVIIPQGGLHYLSFAALTDGSQYLVDEYNISYLPSVSTLPFIRENIRASEGETLLIGNPATGNAKLAPLPFAEKEVHGIAGLFGVNPFIGLAATESKVKKKASKAGILHLAAHGSYNSVAPLYSSIALTPDGQNDGLLEVHEIYGLDLHKMNLVVLSACETQLGELSSGDELVGLTRAFFFAGAPTVVASLWSVDDEATSMLMEQFYTHLRAGLGKADALRQAQIDVRAKYPNPYYWAGFVLSGDGGKIGNSISVSIPWVILICIICGSVVGSILWFRRRK